MQPVRALLLGGGRPSYTHAIAEGIAPERAMRSAEVIDIASAVFAVVLTSALLIAFVSLH
jgi:hypothetical protein